jgi:hypothetical protein
MAYAFLYLREFYWILFLMTDWAKFQYWIFFHTVPDGILHTAIKLLRCAIKPVRHRKLIINFPLKRGISSPVDPIPPSSSNLAPQLLKVHIAELQFQQARKGKPSVKMGRKASGPLSADSRAAERYQHFCWIFSHGKLNISERCWRVLFSIG